MSNDRAAAVIEAVHSAFANAILPGRGLIAYAGTYDAFEIERDFGGCRTKGLSDDVIEKFQLSSRPERVSVSLFFAILR